MGYLHEDEIPAARLQRPRARSPSMVHHGRQDVPYGESRSMELGRDQNQKALCAYQKKCGEPMYLVPIDWRDVRLFLS